MPTGIAKKHRFQEIDALRGVAASIVILSHYTWAYDYHFHLLEDHSFHFLYGDFGVEIFFIISGFVIFMTLARVQTIKEFAISRFSRLYPTFWFCMLITASLITVFPVPTLGHYTIKEILLNITMLPGLFKIRYIDQVYWSLEVELFFYFIMGILFSLKKFRYIDYIVIAWLLLSAISLLLDFPLEKYLRKILILDWAPLFITGILLYKVKFKNANILNHISILAAFIIYCFYVEKKYPGDVVPIILLAAAYFVFYIYAFRGISFLRTKILLFLGDISYPLYLLHNVIGYVILYRVRMYIHNQFLYSIITAFIAVLLAFVVTKYFDKKVVRWTKTKLTNLLKYTFSP